MSGGGRLAAAGLAVAALIGLGIALALAVATLGLHVRRVVSLSMSPTIRRGDWIVVRDVGPAGRRAIHRREIVLFRFPLGTSGRAVKRVVAIGGDRVAISPRLLVVDGRRIAVAGAPSVHAGQQRVETVPDGDIFLLGDNAAVSIDSRSFGVVPNGEVVGRVLFVVHRRTLFLAVAAAGVVVAAALLLLIRRAR